MKTAVIFFHKNIYKIYREQWVNICIESVLNQTYQNFDIFEINYGGEDMSIFKNYRLEGKQHFFYSHDFPDHSYAMNFIINKAFDNGYDVVFNTNLDDIYCLNRFEVQMEYVAKGYDLTSSYWYYITCDKVDDEYLSTVKINEYINHTHLFSRHPYHKLYPQNILKSELNRKHNIINHSCVCYTRKFWNTYDCNENLLRYRDDKPYEDMTLWTRAVNSNSVKMCVIPKYLIWYRVHDFSISAGNKAGTFDNRQPNYEEKRIGILLVCTGKYKHYVHNIVEKIEQYFLTQYKKKYFVFTDDILYFESDSESRYTNTKFIFTKISRKGFPGDTLYRYHYFLKREADITQMTDVIYYMDVDLDIETEVGTDILPTKNQPLIAVRHGGFYVPSPFPDPWGSPETNNTSTAFISDVDRIDNYIAGGVNGGITHYFIKMAKEIRDKVDIDDLHNVVAVWHDESHLNRYYTYHEELFKIMTSSYCYPGNNDIGMERIIVAIDKKHDEIRLSDHYIYYESTFDDTITDFLFKISNLLHYGKQFGLIPMLNYNPKDKKRNKYISLAPHIMLGETTKLNGKNISMSEINTIKGDEHICLTEIDKTTPHLCQDLLSDNIYYKNEHIVNDYKFINKLFGRYTISIHVQTRSHVENEMYYRILSPNYYKKATEHFSSDHTFLIFSDDIDYCKESQMFDHLSRVYYVESNNDIYDLFLMTKCTHHILSNSDYALWCAYLDNNAKTIIVPDKWLYSENDAPYSKLIHDDWIQMSDLDPGLSLVVRARNESKNIIKFMDTLYPFADNPNFEIIFVDNLSEDNTYGHAKNYINLIKNMKIFRYQHNPLEDDKGFEKYYNWCLNQATKYNVMKWDADFICNFKNLQEMIDQFSLCETNRNIYLWCTGKTIFEHNGEWFLKKSSYYDEYRVFSKLHGYYWQQSDNLKCETYGSLYCEKLMVRPYDVVKYNKLREADDEIYNYTPEQFTKWMKDNGFENVLDLAVYGESETKPFIIEEMNGIAHNWKIYKDDVNDLHYIPGIKDVFIKPVFYEVKRVSEQANRDFDIDGRDTDDNTILAKLAAGNIPETIEKVEVYNDIYPILELIDTYEPLKTYIKKYRK